MKAPVTSSQSTKPLAFLKGTLLLLAMLALTASMPLRAGSILPPDATPLGYSITDMAQSVASFSLHNNDPAFYPQTPFQILYRLGNLQDPTGANTFYVKPGTFFYLKFFFIDDSAPIIGNWPADQNG